MQWFLFTNMLIASAPGILWLKRGARNGTRYGASVGLALVILVGAINTFLPGANMWVLSMPEVFDTPLFYLTGAIFVAISAFNLAMLLRLPTKEVSEEIPRLSGESVPPDKWGAGSMSQPPKQVLLSDEPDQCLANPHALYAATHLTRTGTPAKLSRNQPERRCLSPSARDDGSKPPGAHPTGCATRRTPRREERPPE